MADPLSGLRPEPSKNTRSLFDGLSFRPPVWVRNYLPLPRSLDEQFYSDLVDPKSPAGAPKPLVKPMSEFPLDGPDVSDYRKRAWDAYHNRPVIRDKSGEVISPAEWLRREVLSKGGDELDATDAMSGVFDHLTGKQYNHDVWGEPSKAVLEKLRQQGVGGKEEAFPGWTEGEREKARQSGAQETRYMTSPGMRANLDATRSFNILSALQEDPHFKPNYGTLGSLVNSIPFAAVSGLAHTGRHMLTDAQVAPEHDNPVENPNLGALHLAYLRNLHSAANPAEARVMEALYWDKMAHEANKAGQYKSMYEGGFYPQTSFMTTDGMTRQGESDSANWLSYAEKLKNQALSGTNTFDGPEGAAMRDLISDFYRESPVYPDGIPQEKAQWARDSLREYLDGREQRFISEYPLYQENWNNAMGQLGPVGEALKVKEYSFPSPAWNNVAMAPKYWFDVPTLAGLLATGPAIVAQHGVGPLATAVGTDFLTESALMEQPYAAAIYASNPYYGENPGRMIEPTPQGPVPEYPAQVGPGGYPVMAKPDANYREKWERWEQGQKKLLEGLLDFHKNYYQQP